MKVRMCNVLSATTLGLSRPLAIRGEASSIGMRPKWTGIVPEWVSAAALTIRVKVAEKKSDLRFIAGIGAKLHKHAGRLSATSSLSRSTQFQTVLWRNPHSIFGPTQKKR